uniref:FH2 domain containing 3 n=1 Tax=Salarias fasciatus TaxID=181472 RepID=A0A672GCG5_SALFA
FKLPFNRCENFSLRSMKKLNWDTIPSQHVLGKLNVWTSSRPQRDLVLDIRSMEELFSRVDKRASLHSSKVTILDSKRSMNIGIFLRHFKRPVTEIVQDIHQGNWLKFGTGKLQELCKLLPEDIEVTAALLAFSGNLSGLPEADQFMVQLVRVPGYEEHLKTMVLREEFFPLMEDVKNSVVVMTKAANELLDCDDLHSVIRLVLKAGNYMNAGGYSANAIGFRMTSLLKLADTKANKPGMNLMHYVAKQAEGIDPELLSFPTQLDHIGMASRICKDEVIGDFENEVKKIQEVKSFSKQQPDFIQQMDTFLMMDSFILELKALSKAVAEYFCEDPATFKLEECCSIFHSFCKRFDTAVKENKEREAAEQRRKRKENLRIKRRSTMSGPKPDPSSDSACLESALHDFLSTAPEGLARCRKNAFPPVRGSSHEHSSPSGSVGEKTEGTVSVRKESPAKKQPKLPPDSELQSNAGLKQEVDKMHEMSRKVLRYQKSRSSLDGDRVPGSPHCVVRKQDKPVTPRTPRPRTRDYFFANNGSISSPWTILSPFMCPEMNHCENGPSDEHMPPSAFGGEDLDDDDGVWVSDESSTLSCSSDRDSQSSSVSLPECFGSRTPSQSPVQRSLSVDETGRSSPSGFRLGDLFQRTKNCEERQVNASGFMSFFRRIGGKGKAGAFEELNV